MKVWKLSLLIGLAILTPQISSTPTHASEFAVSQYGRVTATLPWAVALKKGYFADEGIKIDHIISGKGGGTTLRNLLASDLPYGEVATSAALAAQRSGVDIVIVNTASDNIGEISLVANPKSNIHKVADLAGKNVGFTNPKSTSELLDRLALKEAGMTGKVQLIGTGGFGGGLTMVNTGGVDAVPLIDPDTDASAGEIPRHISFRRPHSAHDVARRRHHAKVRQQSTPKPFAK